MLRRAFNSLSNNIVFQNKNWVLKKYHDSWKNIVDELGTDVEWQEKSHPNVLLFKASCNYIWLILDSWLVTKKSIMVCVGIFCRRNRIKSWSQYPFQIGEICRKFCVTWFRGNRLPHVWFSICNYWSLV